MSINIGNLNSHYTLNKFNNNDNRIIINSYNNSNVILLNSENGTNKDAVINYKNQYNTGSKDGIYIIDDINCNVNIVSLSKNNFKINTPLFLNNDINIKNLLLTSNNTTYINSNLIINLYNTSNLFNINHLAKKIVDISLNNINLSISNTLLNINNNGVNIYSDIYTNSNNILYVNNIKSNNPNSSIKIYNPYLIGLQIQSSIIYDNISIINDANTYNNPSFKIERYYNNFNILQLSTCNIINTNIKLDRNFTIDKDGFVGIGSRQPTAPLSISKINPIIFEYNGLNYGDKFNISENAYVGIGTTNSKSLLTINRCDDLKEQNIRTNPLININIDYQESSNYTTSNYKSTIFDIFTYNSIISYSNFLLNTLNTSNISLTSNNILIDLLSEINLIPFEQNNAIRSNINVVNNFHVHDSKMYDNISNISNIIINNKIEFLTISETLQIDEFNNYIIRNKICYPDSLYGIEKYDAFSFNYTSNIINSIKNYYYDYTYILYKNIISSNIFNRYSSNFHLINYKSILPTLNTSSFINYNVNLYVEKNKYNINYIDTKPVLQKPPYFLYASSNNNFCASLSSYSTLSLGSLAPVDNKYLLYAPSRCLLSTIETDTITTITSSNLYFSHCNLKDINNIECHSNISDFINTNTAYINNLNVNNISLKIQSADYINTSNIKFNTLNSEYLICDYSNINISTFFSIGNNDSKQLNKNSLVKITIDDNIISSNKFYKHNKALTITNYNNSIVNPTLTIYGANNSLPYLNLSTNSSDYFMRINCNLFQYSTNEWSDTFQLCCDTITGTSRENYYNLTQPHILQHIKKYNLMTIGENNNICFDILDRASISSITQPFTNSTNKISLGLPIGIIDSNSVTYSDWPQYFANNIINNNPYMLNVYGNVNISSIYGKSIIKASVDNGTTKNSSLEKVSVSIGGEPDINTTLYVYGNGVYNSNLSTSNNLYVLNEAFVTKDLTVRGRIFTSDGVTTISDRNLKKDITKINNALEKICNISGYIYTRIDTGNRESGLIAQEVNTILPEVINNNANSLMSISYGNMSGIIIEAIKELKEKIDSLEKIVYSMDTE